MTLFRKRIKVTNQIRIYWNVYARHGKDTINWLLQELIPHSEKIFTSPPGPDPRKEVRRCFLTSTLVHDFRWQAVYRDSQFSSMRFKAYKNSSKATIVFLDV